MARGNFASDFLRTFNIAYDTTNNVGRDFALAKVAKAEEQPFELQGPGTQAEGGAALEGKGVTFLGQQYEKPLTEEQKSMAREAAMAGVFERFGDPERAASLRQRGQQRKLTDLQIGNAERQAEKDKRADADEATLRDIDGKVAEWAKARLTNLDGTTRDMTPDDHLEVSQYRVAQLVGAGKLKEANLLAKDNMQMAAQKIQLQTAERNEALATLGAQVAAGDLSGLGAFYERYVPDGAKITNVTQDPKTGSIKIERESLDGRPLAPTTFKNRDEALAGLKTFQDPMALYNFSQNEFARHLQERQVRNQERQIGNAERRLDKAEAEKREGTAAAVALFKKNNPNASPEEIEAVRTGVLPVIPKANDGQPAEVKLAQAMVASGLAPDMKTALESAVTKKPMSPQERYFELSKPQGGIQPNQYDVARVMAEVYGPDWKEKIKANKAAPAAGGPAPGTVVDGFRFKGGDPKDQRNWELAK